jgi:hypothetical protein
VIHSSKVRYSSSLRILFLNLSRRFATLSAESCCYSSARPRMCTLPVRILETEYILECSRKRLRPGVQWLQDPRSEVYRFSTWLEQIIPVKNFAFERLQTFMPSSRDEVRNHSFTKDTINTNHLGSVYYSKTRRSKIRGINFVFIRFTQPIILPHIWRQARTYSRSQHVFQI